MIDIAEHIASYLPPDWRMTHIIGLDSAWQAIATNGEYVATATGGSIEEALAEVAQRAEEGTYCGRIFDGVFSLRANEKASVADILNGLARKPEPFKRRL